MNTTFFRSLAVLLVTVVSVLAVRPEKVRAAEAGPTCDVNSPGFTGGCCTCPKSTTGESFPCINFRNPSGSTQGANECTTTLCEGACWEILVTP
jgi:hypothetical protein